MIYPKIEKSLIQKLIEIGMCEDILNAITNANLQEEDGRIMRYGPIFWREKAKYYSKDELIALIKCLTIIEYSGKKGWDSGSVSPVIYLFEHLIKVEPDLEILLGNWILSHTKNPYLPYGWWNWNANSIDEYHSRVAGHVAYVERCHAEEEERKNQAKIRKAEKATKNLAAAIKRGDFKAIKALIETGADPNGTDKDGTSYFELALNCRNFEVRELFDQLRNNY